MPTVLRSRRGPSSGPPRRPSDYRAQRRSSLRNCEQTRRLNAAGKYTLCAHVVHTQALPSGASWPHWRARITTALRRGWQPPWQQLCVAASDYGSDRRPQHDARPSPSRQVRIVQQREAAQNWHGTTASRAPLPLGMSTKTEPLSPDTAMPAASSRRLSIARGSAPNSAQRDRAASSWVATTRTMTCRASEYSAHEYNARAPTGAATSAEELRTFPAECGPGKRRGLNRHRRRPRLRRPLRPSRAPRSQPFAARARPGRSASLRLR